MRYWRIMPTNPQPREQFDSVWAYDLGNNTIAISWWQLGDVRKLSEAQFDSVCVQHYPETADKPGSRSYIRNAILRFHGVVDNGVLLGDKIIACRGQSSIVGIGTVVGPSSYDETRGLTRIGAWKQHRGSHFLPVRWDVRREFMPPPNFNLPRNTFSGLPAERYRELIAAIGSP